MPIFCYDSKLVFQTPLKSMCIWIAQESAPRVLLTLGPRHFPCKFSHKMVLVACSCACRLHRPRLAQNGCPGLGARHFSCKFSLKLALVTCPCAFRLRRLAKNGCPGPGAQLFLKDLPKKSSSDMSMSISNAQARTKRKPNFWDAASSCIFSHKLVLVTSACAF